MPAAYDRKPPRNAVFRWLWKYSQIILSALTLLVLIVYGAQWWQARETRELENRAYVIVKSIAFRQAPDNPAMSHVVITITNTGKTPGLNGSTVVHSEGRDNPIPDDAGFPPLDSPPSKTVLAPQVDVEIRLGPFPNLLSEQIAARQAIQQQAKAGSKPAGPTPSMPASTPAPAPATKQPKYSYVYGVINYDDIFGRPHQTTFCYFNTPRTSEWWGCTAFNSFK